MASSARDLTQQLRKYDFASLSSSDCARALRVIVDWLRESSFYSRRQQPLSQLRFQKLFRELDQDTVSKANVHALLISTLKFFDLSTLLTQTGLSRPHGFFDEFISRLVGRILPRHSPRPNFMDLVYFLFPVDSDAEFLQKIPRDLYDQILILFDPDLKTSTAGRALLGKHFHQEILESMLILSAECLVVSESTLINDIRWTLSGAKKERHSFLQLHNFVHKMVGEKIKHPKKINEEAKEEFEDEFSEILSACRHELSDIMSHLEESSLSVDLVYQIEVLQLLLDRIRAILFIFIFNGETGPKSLEFFAALIAEEQRRRSVRVLINQNLHYLSRKIVDNAGETGEHYIARNPYEFRELFKSAFGGGFITGFTVIFKIFLHFANLALFFEGFFGTVNYAGSFIGMQFMHLTLATKQPAMTAASLAKKMTSTRSDLKELREEMKNLLKSQALTATGNILAIIPTSYCLFLVWQLFFSTPLLDRTAANQLIDAHLPFSSLTFFYAIITGVILWSASIVHGWVQNWMVFRGIPELLSDSFLLENFLSRSKRLHLSKWLRKNLAGITSNTVLGGLLAFAPIFGHFFGIPLEVRHVTLSAGTLAIAWASVPSEDITTSRIILSATGIVVIMLANLATSFTLSLWLALKARGWHLSDVKSVFRSR